MPYCKVTLMTKFFETDELFQNCYIILNPINILITNQSVRLTGFCKSQIFQVRSKMQNFSPKLLPVTRLKENSEMYVSQPRVKELITHGSCYIPTLKSANPSIGICATDNDYPKQLLFQIFAGIDIEPSIANKQEHSKQ